jgi:SAM-dependent methyltransferase
MFAELIPVLACPWCRAGGLTADRNISSDERIMNVTLTCVNCPKSSEVRDGIWFAMGPVRRQRSLAQLTNVWPNAIFYESLWRPGALSRFSGRRFPLAEELGELTAALKPRLGSIMVDVAASEGLYARTLAQSGATVLAVEHSVPMLKKVLKRAVRASARVAPVYAIAQHLPFVDSAIDGVACGGSMNEIGDRQGAVDEMARVLRSGAALFSMQLTTARTAVGRVAQASVGPSGINFATAREWADLFVSAGLSVRTEHNDRVVQRLHLTKLAH